jgi:hypothetical protein
MALMAVLLVTALAAVLGYSLLSSSAVQSRAAANLQDVHRAELIADSGINFALYCLANPDKAPSLAVGAAGNTHYPGGADLALLGSDFGVVSIEVTNTALDRYTVVATGVHGQARRAFEVSLELPSEYRVTHAMSAAADVSLPSNAVVNGSLRSDGVVTLPNRGIVRGAIEAINGASLANASITPSFPTRGNPSWNDLNLVRSLNATHPVIKTWREYYLNGNRYYAEPLPSTLITGRLQTLNVLTNPANVWYSNSTVTLRDAEIDGTIVVRGSGTDVIIEGSSTVRSANSALPAIVVRDDLLFRSGAVTSLSVEGILWIGDDISVTSGSSTSCSLQVRGSLLMGGTGSIVKTNFRGTVTVVYDELKVRAPDLSNSNRWPTGMRVLSWQAKRL